VVLKLATYLSGIALLVLPLLSPLILTPATMKCNAIQQEAQQQLMLMVGWSHTKDILFVCTLQQHRMPKPELQVIWLVLAVISDLQMTFI